ncbi:MAG TPA: prolipoprotein diacylglyceryl transferase [Longimicrobiales bacterium]|nr:prolipoprotein diacylglyceryl transferase [Longimicrobiales bacterium]
MYPEILRIGDFVITSFGVMMFLSFITAAFFTGRQLQRYGLPKDYAWDMLAWCALGGIAGAKIYYLALHWQALVANPLAEILSRGGLVWYGGLIGGIVAYWLQVRARKLPMATMYDATAPALAIAYAVGRLGCFLVGDDYGRYTDGPFGIAFPEGAPPSTAGILRSMGETVPAHIADATVVPVHPTQLYEIGLALIMFGILWRLGTNRGFRTGQLFAVYMVLYGLERFVIEFVRAKSDRIAILGVGLSTSQLMSVLLVAFGAWLFFRRRAVGAPAPLVDGPSAEAGAPAPATAPGTVASRGSRRERRRR